MKKLATLGPKGTYSELASLKYIHACEESHKIEYFPSIKKVLASVGEGCDIAVLPIENFSEGFVSLVLDHLIDSDLTIVSEIVLPIQFSFVSNVTDMATVNKLFVQFVAKGQCSEYIDTLANAHVVSTQSNIESLDMVLSEACNSGAIVPSESFDSDKFNTVVKNVNDYENNQTRFLVLSKVRTSVGINTGKSWKTSFVILDDHDRPGLLAEILTSFSSRGINLTSIISRPTRVAFGRYNFLIDINGHMEDRLVSDAINEINSIASVKVMGSYLAAESI